MSVFLALTGLALAQGPTMTTAKPVTKEVGVVLTHIIRYDTRWR